MSWSASYARKDIAQVVIALPSASHEAIMRIVDHCRHEGVQFRLVPDLYEMSLGRLDMNIVSGIPLMGMKEPAIRGVNFFLKRGIDVGPGRCWSVPCCRGSCCWSRS